MTAAAQPTFEPGRVYRTRDLSRWSANAPRLAQRLVQEGQLLPVSHGLFVAPKRSRFGVVPPTDESLMRAFLDDSPFVFTGPEHWNALRLGTTAVFAMPLVYNEKRSGTFDLGGRKFILRRVAFPKAPTAEWFVIDLFENADRAATSPEDVARRLAEALRAGRFDHERLVAMAERYGSRRTQALVRTTVASASARPR